MYFTGWLSSLRPKTLLLSFAALSLGNAAAYRAGKFNPLILVLALLTGIGLQILSNLCNDYGDFTKGTDTETRTGPLRAIHLGTVDKNQLMKIIISHTLIVCLTGVGLLFYALREGTWAEISFFFLLGLLSIAAAYFYTMSKIPYGYKGMGDLSVFVFFGLIAVSGSYYLQTREFNPEIILPAFAMGAFGIGVLNINNIRDAKQDVLNGKITMAVRFGPRGALIYETSLVVSALLSIFFYLWPIIPLMYLFPFFIITALPFAILVSKMFRIIAPQELNPILGKFSASVFQIIMVTCLGLLIF